jgi:hypothetical protein
MRSRPKRATQAQADLILQKHADQIRSLAKRTVEDIVKIGRLLTAAKKRIPHGGWLSWLQREFGWSADTATNYMNVYKVSRRPGFRKIRNMAKVAPTLLYKLAAAPDEVVDNVVERLNRGEKVGSNVRYVTVTKVHRKLKIVSPYYVKPDRPSPPSWPARVVQFPTPTGNEVAAKRTDALALIDALEQADDAVLAEVLDLLHGERQDALAAVVRAAGVLLDAGIDREKRQVFPKL